ncbi:type II toxin-antitoxin system YafQ family toxin [Endozoicomonas sp. 4G]|uniref:type II toxin-antitoxin system YafQ family toxin n=1 Tax=Endozoicomonas sp. 4G TaxID=2872754 RepID=UPI00207882D3|nr:type II toxin-antitoxin system YafQ family toxin [Endozoicomonas sp. 4G]
MLVPVFLTRFDKDVKKAKKQGKDMEKLKFITRQLVEQKPLAPRYRDHLLTGNYNGRRECHIEPDWLLIYRLADDCIFFERLGSHSELFK